MSPILYIIAGPNGSGKSSNAKTILPKDKNLKSFDFDKIKLDYYRSLPDSELREEFSHNHAISMFEEAKGLAIATKSDFVFETNFNSDEVISNIYDFIDSGYEVYIYFIDLITVSFSKKRVDMRVRQGGHFVREQEIEERYRLSAENINKYYTDFDLFVLYDSSSGTITKIAETVKGKIIYKTEDINPVFLNRFHKILI